MGENRGLPLLLAVGFAAALGTGLLHADEGQDHHRGHVGVKKGDRLTTVLADGTVESEII